MDETPDIGLLEEALGYTFKRRTLLETALTHRSARDESDNERLEFLGDAVIDLAIRDLLLARFPKATVGHLARWRSYLASRRALAEVGSQLRLRRYLQHNSHEISDRSPKSLRALADALEAVFGAIYLDSDYPTASLVARSRLEALMDAAANDPHRGNHKNALQELWQKQTGETPIYEVVVRTGPSHDPLFKIAVILGGEHRGTGEGGSKREASQNAARDALTKLNAETHVAYVGIGSNQGDRLGYLRAALTEIEAGGDRVTRVSSVYETEPVGEEDQPWFLNAVVRVETGRAMRPFHQRLKEAEKVVGRRPTRKWGPREIDLDLLFFDDERVATDHLTVPHPHLHERNFVMTPLAEIAPHMEHPTLGKRIDALKAAMTDPKKARWSRPPAALSDDCSIKKESTTSLNLSQNAGV